MTFIKTTPGHACKIALKADAGWYCPNKHATWQEARDPYGNVVAYNDNSGWYINEVLENENVEDIIA